MCKFDVYLTEQSIKELFEGKDIFDEDGIIHPPKTNELGLYWGYKWDDDDD